MFCPFCRKDFPEDAAFTKEHIVAAAIGGSLALSISVCNPCNSGLGSRVDAPFLRDFFISSKRLELGLVGQSGQSPELTFTGTMKAFGKDIPGEYSITPESKKLHATKPFEQKDGNIGIVGGDKQTSKILAQLQNAYAQKGHTLNNINISKEVPEMHVTMQFNLSVLDRAFVKIALALAHKELGEEFSKSSDAQKLRDFMWEEDREKREAMKLQGNIQLLPDSCGELIKDNDSHVTALLNTSEHLAFIGLIFGQYQAIIRVCPPLSDIVPGDGWIYITHPRTRQVESYPLARYIAEHSVKPNS